MTTRNNNDIFERVLLIGPDYKRPKGGIAQVLNVYSKYYRNFNFITTLKDGTAFSKVFTLLDALFAFVFIMLFNRSIKIVHIHGTANNSMKRKSLFVNLAKLFNKKVIYHVHSATLPECDKTQHDFIKKTLCKCDVVIALTPYWNDYIKRTYNCKRVITVENIVDYPKMTTNQIQEDKSLTFLYLGLISNHKGIYDLIDVVREHHYEYQGKAKFVVAGNGETEKFQSLIKEYGISDVISYYGWASGDKKAELLNQCDVYIQPTYAEGQPISILEALSYKKPILTTPVGGIPDIVKDNYNGILFTPGDKVALATAITRFLEMPSNSIQQMGENSHSLVASHMPNEVISKLETIYTELL